ncbi:MAG: hypothetical protein ACK521_11435, partial [bacterium]
QKGNAKFIYILFVMKEKRKLSSKQSPSKVIDLRKSGKAQKAKAIQSPDEAQTPDTKLASRMSPKHEKISMTPATV